MAYVVGESSDRLTVDSGKCIRTSLYGNEGPAIIRGFPLSGTELARGAIAFNFPGLGALGSGNFIIWALRNSSTDRFILVHSVCLQAYTAGLASTGQFRLELDKHKNVTSITATGGGVVTLTPSIFKTALGQATAADSKVAGVGLNSSLDLNGNINLGAIISFRAMRLTPSATVQSAMSQTMLHGPDVLMTEPIRLDENETVSLRNAFTSTPTNLALWGSAFFTEHAL